MIVPLEQGVHPKVVADLLGHATVATTLDLYSHVAMAMPQEAVDAMEAVLEDPDSSQVGATVGSAAGEKGVIWDQVRGHMEYRRFAPAATA